MNDEELIYVLKRSRTLLKEEIERLNPFHDYLLDFHESLLGEINEFLWKVKGVSVKDE